MDQTSYQWENVEPNYDVSQQLRMVSLRHMQQ